MIKPYYQEKNITIYNGDCLEIMKEIDNESVDLIFADPSYGISKKGKFEIPEKSYKRIFAKWDMREPDYQWIDESIRILKRGRAIYISGTHHNIFKIREYFLKKYSEQWIRNFITWFKPNAMPIKFAKHIGVFAYSCEYILYITKGKCEYFTYNQLKAMNNGKQVRDMWVIKVGQDIRQGHPTQKPEALLRRIIIASSREKEIVLDPFIGSGTTARVCKDLGRKCIGIEISKEYCDIAVKRLAQEVLDFSGVSND